MPGNVLDWLQQYLGGDPEAQASADASRAMEPVVGPYLAKVASGDVIKESLDNVNAAFANHDYPALAGMFSGAGGGIKAYHASPFSFDRFDIGKVSTGQGVQSYGHGLYAAESPAVSGPKGAYDREFTARNLGKQDLNQGETQVLRMLRDNASDPDVIGYLAKSGYSFDEALKTLNSVKQAKASIYGVDINAEPEQFLSWDKPLNQQSEYVQSTLGLNKPTEFFETLAHRTKNTGADYYARLSRLGGAEVMGDKARFFPEASSPKHASQMLNEAGVPGIRYFDQFSRAPGEGTSNYVVFNDELIKILRKYGIVPPVAGGALGGMLGEEPQQ